MWVINSSSSNYSVYQQACVTLDPLEALKCIRNGYKLTVWLSTFVNVDVRLINLWKGIHLKWIKIFRGTPLTQLQCLNSKKLYRSFKIWTTNTINKIAITQMNVFCVKHCKNRNKVFRCCYCWGGTRNK